MKTLTLVRPHGFSLDAAREFYAGFTPGAGMAAAEGSELTLAFRLDGSFEAVVVALREEDGAVTGCYEGTDDEATLAKQVARILGTEVDGADWLAVGRRDPVVAGLQSEFPGFFTAAKSSPYDAAAWAVLSPRLPMNVAAKLKTAIAEKHGTTVRFASREHHVFPSPAQVAQIDSFPGLPAEKLVRLKGIALAASEGLLDAERLRALDEHAALAELMSLRGVGPWSASHILYRGAASIDGLPTAEPRVLHGLGVAYGIAAPTDADLERLSAPWRPFRMWVSILLSRHLGRVGGWQRPGLVKERASAGQRLVAKLQERRAVKLHERIPPRSA